MSLIMSLVIQTTTMTTIDSSRMNATLSTMIQLATPSSLTISQIPKLLIRCDAVMAHTVTTTAFNSTTTMSAVNLSLNITNSTTMRQRLTFTTHILFTRHSCPVNGSFIERSEMTRTMRTMRKISIIVMDTPMVQLLLKSSNRQKRSRTNQLRKSKYRSSLKLLISSSNLSKEVHWTSYKV